MKKSTILTFASFILAVFGLFSWVSQVSAAGMDGCAKECGACQTSCEKATTYLKSKGASAKATAATNTLADCIDLCRASQSLLQRDSKLHPQVCKVCAQACNECAKACETLHDPKLKDCIEECKKCADSCTHMSS